MTPLFNKYDHWKFLNNCFSKKNAKVLKFVLDSLRISGQL